MEHSATPSATAHPAHSPSSDPAPPSCNHAAPAATDNDDPTTQLTTITNPLLTLPHLPTLFDVHAHLTDTPTVLPHLATKAHTTGTVALMGTRPSDWLLVLDALATHPRARIVGGLGIHPWFAHTIEDVPDMIAQLEAHLMADPAMFVGEIGVDKAAKNPETGEVYDWDTQEQVFMAQWEVAVRMQRPVSMHCVHAQGWVLRFMKAQADKAKGMDKREVATAKCWPPAVMLHSFNGSHDLIAQLVKLKGIGSRLYFSYSMFVSSRSNKVADRIKATPDGRVLLESDVHRADWVDASMANVLELVAGAKGWDVAETARRAGRENAERWYTSGRE
ncbi:hypothetical protein BCR44DRAFT_1428738 [Catenaria anguillulae PL171]|uniref:TatD family n=1 Tax=Catenaria anguillulae PL171 TaxID=765915 RepID=A0A1Y2HVN0_9FUNG|nr:hypothetical protein BCR44DRAFT_1428738 [Catenaria anguillulae PL171]